MSEYDKIINAIRVMRPILKLKDRSAEELFDQYFEKNSENSKKIYKVKSDPDHYNRLAEVFEMISENIQKG